MKQNRIFKLGHLVFALILFLIGGYLILLPKLKILLTQAGIQENIRGWIWSSADSSSTAHRYGVGWISLNCLNNYDNDEALENCCPGGIQCTEPNIPSTTCCPFPYSIAGGNYGLKLEDNKISGYAWSGSINNPRTQGGLGWLCFGESCREIAPDQNPSWACLGKRTINGGCLGDCGEDFNHPTNSVCTNQLSDNSLRGHWKMNEGDGTIVSDDSGNNNNGTLLPSGSEPTWTKGRFKRALKFDGINDYVLINNSDSLQINEGTVEAWIKISSTNGLQGVVVKEGAYGLFIKDGVFGIYDYSDNDFRSSDVNIVINKWYHLAVTFQSKVVDGTKLYVDGELKKTTTMTILNQKSDLGIGMADVSIPSQFFSGSIDNVSIWSRVKSAAEIWDDAKIEISGWAKFVWTKEPNKGWVKLRDLTQDNNYGLELIKFGRNYELKGFAWHHSSLSNLGLGWLKFGYGGCQDITLLSPPPDFQVTSYRHMCNTLMLKWDPSCAQSYKIYRCQNDYGDNNCTINEDNKDIYFYKEIEADEVCEQTKCHYLDVDLESLTNYGFRIEAINFNSESGLSEIKYKVTPLCPPQPGSVTPIDISKCGEITINWQPEPKADNGYRIYRGLREDSCVLDENSNYNPVTCKRIKEISDNSIIFYTDKQIIANINYYYWATSVHSLAGESDFGVIGSGQSICLSPIEWKEK